MKLLRLLRLLLLIYRSMSIEENRVVLDIGGSQISIDDSSLSITSPNSISLKSRYLFLIASDDYEGYGAFMEQAMNEKEVISPVTGDYYGIKTDG